MVCMYCVRRKEADYTPQSWLYEKPTKFREADYVIQHKADQERKSWPSVTKESWSGDVKLTRPQLKKADPVAQSWLDVTK